MGIIEEIDRPAVARVRDLLERAREFSNQGRLDRAESLYREVLALEPDHPGALQNLGLIAYKTGHAAHAVTLMARAVTAGGENPELLFQLANAHFAAGSSTTAAGHYRRAIQLEPSFFAALVNLSNTLLQTGDLAAAGEAARRALALHPASAEAHSNLGQVLLRRFQAGAAVRTMWRALEGAANKSEALTNLGAAMQLAGDVDGAMDCFRQALQIDPACHLAERNMLFAMLNQPQLSEQDRFETHRRYGARHRKQGARRVRFSFAANPSSLKLKIGYVSSDFRDHPVGRNLLPLIRNHDRSAFEIHLYAEEEAPDEMSDEFRAAADRWTSTGPMTDAGLAERMRRDGINLAVFLAGRFNRNRPLVAAHRAAPVQISFHDCATSGLEEMDYWLTDALLHPDDCEERFTEILYRLPVFYQFTVPESPPATSPPPSATNGYVTFGCFNKPEKINGRVLSIWAEILRRLPEARLALKYRALYIDEAIQDGWRRRFAAIGLEPERLEFLSGDDGLEDHLKAYGGIDIALDPFPFNGATTTFEALLAGVPVVAFWGVNFAARVAAALLVQSGAGDLAAASQEDYVATACRLAGDGTYLAALRENLGRQLLGSKLCDAAAYTKSVEAAYWDMWRQRC